MSGTIQLLQGDMCDPDCNRPLTSEVPRFVQVALVIFPEFFRIGLVT